MKKIIEKIVCTIVVCVLLWGVFSTFEVWDKNLDKNPDYSPCNMWVLLFNECRE